MVVRGSDFSPLSRWHRRNGVVKSRPFPQLEFEMPGKLIRESGSLLLDNREWGAAHRGDLTCSGYRLQNWELLRSGGEDPACCLAN